MEGLKDILYFLLPIPPPILMRSGEFPNCSEIFADISKNPPSPRALGRIFSRLCGLAAFSWLIWGISFIIFAVAVIMLLYYWGANRDMGVPAFLGFLSCRMLLAMSGACLFVGKIVFIGTTNLSLQLSERCYEHINNRPPVKIKVKQKR